MLIVRREQMSALSQARLVAFEREMLRHSRTVSPNLSRVLGEERLRAAIQQGIQAARAYGFTYRGPIRLFLELRFLFGSGFDIDPQYPWAAEILRSFQHQMQRADRLHHQTVEYGERVAGPNSVNTRVALKELSVMAGRPLPFSAADFTGDMLREMHRVFPQKVEFTGIPPLRALIAEGLDLARRHQFEDIESQAMLVVLMFAFGHSCASDPLYPWISNTIEDPRIIDPAARARRLRKKSLTWLGSVLASPAEVSS